MFERFSERARQVLVLAQDEARLLGHNYLGTEHLLLGLIREEDGLAARVLGSLGVTLAAVREQVGRIVGQAEPVTGQIPFTPRTKRVLQLALREAADLGSEELGTEHVLLGLARENDGVAARILLDLGIEATAIRAEVLRLLSVAEPARPRGARRASASVAAVRAGPGVLQHLPAAAMVFLGWAVGAVTLGLGILLGWAIWG